MFTVLIVVILAVVRLIGLVYELFYTIQLYDGVYPFCARKYYSR